MSSSYLPCRGQDCWAISLEEEKDSYYGCCAGLLRSLSRLVSAIFLGKYSRSTPARVSRCPQCLQASYLACALPSRWRRQGVQALCSQAGIILGWLPSAKGSPQAQQLSSWLIFQLL